ncbi:MAG: hypothetical protein A2096_07325 [Spirochaetes bacterium GWF1_41_5]|nr:MAG: hypothetical protein A2096_07325 [Spirochaetes bacterium GWF1_41_5]HBE02482.1 hypothetical protein [Spirochaetia bacterium]
MRLKNIFFIILASGCLMAERFDFTFAVLKYSGGGDWYEGLTGAKELMHFFFSNTGINCRIDPVTVSPLDPELFRQPFCYLTGHGSVSFSPAERTALRTWCLAGGFLLANDDYGMDTSFRQEMTKIFPEYKLTEIPAGHEIFRCYYIFSDGLPKIHKHAGGRPEAWGIIYNKRIMVFYIFNTDIGDGWAPYQVHKNSETVRLEALKMGVNILTYSMLN